MGLTAMPKGASRGASSKGMADRVSKRERVCARARVCACVQDGWQCFEGD